MTTVDSIIREAVRTSIDNDEVVRVRIDDAARAIFAIKAIAAESGLELDWSEESDGSADVWAFDPDGPEGAMTWLLRVEGPDA